MQLATLARRYISMGWQHRWKALALAWVICLVGWAGVYTIPDRYQSSARVYADADAVLGQLLRGIAIDSSPANQVELLQRTLLSQPNLERVIARTDLDLRLTNVASREGLVQRLAKDIKISAQTRNLFTITYSDSNARLARDVVQALLTLFIESATSTDRQQMENARNFVAQQVAVYEGQLREAEQRRAEFRTRYLDILPSDALGGITRLEQSRSRLQQLRGELQDLRQRRELLRQQLETVPATLTAAEIAAATGGGGDSRLAEAERALRELRLRYTEQHPDVIAARSNIAELRASPAPASGGGSRAAGPRAAARTNPMYEQLKLRLLDVDAETGSLERQVRDEQAEVERLDTLARNAPQVQAQFQNLDRDYSVIRKSYEDLLARRESVQIAGAARSGAERVRLEVVDPPTVPSLPSGPNRLLFATGVLVFGLGAGAGLALLLVQFDRTFYMLQDLRQLGLPVLGGISAAGPARQMTGAVVAFASSFALLLIVFAVVLAGGPSLMARIPSLVARMVA